MEIFDIYNAQKKLTGKTGTRGIPLKAGEFRYVVRIIIFNDEGTKVLIQQRQSTKTIWPNYWDFTASGGVISGEDLHEAASRELFEEMGIKVDFSNIPSRLTIRFYEGWSEIFIIQKNVKLEDLKLQENEVSDAKWVTENELNDLIETGKFIPFHYAGRIFDYIRFDGETRTSKN